MQRKKAIVIGTGEIVTIHSKKEVYDEIHYTIFEDANRQFIPDELRIIDDNWEFIMKWLPDYDFSDEVAYSDDLQCCIEGEADEARLERVREMFGKTPEQWERAQLEIDANLLARAVDNFCVRVYHHQPKAQ